MKSYVAIALVIALTGLSSTGWGQEYQKPKCMKQLMKSIRMNNVATNARTQMLKAASNYMGSAPAAVNRHR